MKTATPTAATAKPLTSDEQVRKGELEHTIETGKAAFLEVGQALAEIQKSKLYRDQFDTFDAYCKTRWQFSDNYARRLVSASKVVKQLESQTVPIGTVKSEAVARELGKLPEGDRPAVLANATAAAKKAGKPSVTAKDVADAAEKAKPAEKPEPPKSATSDPEPWNRRYHPLHDKATGALADFKAAMVELARLDSTDASFASWIVEKDWRKTIDGIAATLDAHRVVGWASSAEKARMPDGRPFLFKIDKKAGRKSA